MFSQAMCSLLARLAWVNSRSFGKCNGVTEFEVCSLQSIQAALRDEALFFQKNYPALASRNGTPYLSRTLNKVKIISS